MSCPICGLFFSAVERVALRTHKRFHGAFVMLEADEAEHAQVPITQASSANAKGEFQADQDSNESSSAFFRSSH